MEINQWLVEFEEQLSEHSKIGKQIGSNKHSFQINTDSLGTQLELTFNDGRTLNLNSFLPNGYVFHKYHKFTTDHTSKQVCYIFEDLESAGGLLSLFHEIGHSNDTSKPPSNVLMLGCCLTYLIFQICFLIAKTTYRSGRNSLPYLLVFLKAASLESFYPKWFKLKFHQYKAKRERFAWAYAFRTLRRLKQQNMNLFDGFADVTEIRALSQYSLWTYQCHLQTAEILLFKLGFYSKISETPLVCYTNSRQFHKYIRRVRGAATC